MATSETERKPIEKVDLDLLGKVVSDLSPGGAVQQGVVVEINARGMINVAHSGRTSWYEPNQLTIVGDNVNDFVARSIERVREAHREQLRGLAKDLSVLGREQNAEDEVRQVLTDNGVQPASELYRMKVQVTVWLDVRPNSVNAFDKVTSGTPDLDWLTNSINVMTEGRNGEGGNLYLEPDSDFEFEGIYLESREVLAVTEQGE